MTYARVLLSGFSAILIALLTPLFVFALQHQGSPQKAYGIDILAFAGLASLASPIFWMIAIPIFVMFFVASRLKSKILRVILFWTPTVLMLAVSLGFFSLVLGPWLHFRNT